MSEGTPAYGYGRGPGGRRSETGPRSDNCKRIGGRLRALRRSKGMSVSLLSERTGVPANEIDLIESGAGTMPLSTIDALARALGVSLVVFLDD